MGGLGLPLACLGLDTMRRQLLFAILAPLGITALLLFFVRNRLQIVLPLVLYVTFFISPAASSYGGQCGIRFRAHTCAIACMIHAYVHIRSAWPYALAYGRMACSRAVMTPLLNPIVRSLPCVLV